MKLPKVVADLIDAQYHFNPDAYAACFSETALVHDEGHAYVGREEIKQWISKANSEYNTVMKPLSFEETEGGSLLTAEVSGTFPGSPVVLKFYLQIADGLITSLKIAG